MNFFLHIVAITSMTLMHALGYNLVFGKAKIFHFGPIGTSICAGYATFIALQYSGTYWIGVPAGIAAAMLLSLLFAWLSFRLDPDGLGIMTIAVHLAMVTVVINWTSLTRGALGLPRIPRMPLLTTPLSFAAVVFVIAALCVWGMWTLERSAFGRQLEALAEQEWHAKSLGVSRVRTHLIAFLICGFAGFLANLFYHQYLYLVHPSDFGFPIFIFYMMLVIAGKPGSTVGIVASTVLLTLVKEGLRFVPLPSEILGPTRLLLFGVILLVAVWIRRDSLFPKKRTI